MKFKKAFVNLKKNLEKQITKVQKSFVVQKNV